MKGHTMLFIAQEMNEEMNEEMKSQFNKAMMEYTTSCARMQGAWTCSDCGLTYTDGIPMECFHKYIRCDSIILRDKIRAGVPWE